MNAWLMNYGLAEMENLVSCRPLLMKFGWLSRKGVLAHGIPANQQQTNFIQQLSPALKRKEGCWLVVGGWFHCRSLIDLIEDIQSIKKTDGKSTSQQAKPMQPITDLPQAVLTQLKFLFNWRTVKPYKDKVYDNSKVSRHRGAKQWMLWIYY